VTTVRITHVAGPTALIEVAGRRLLPAAYRQRFASTGIEGIAAFPG
jgi:hypothetical protein